eukprot:XP_011618664.1 PREDICTED: NACHT, LRR and PYD domains-containing protein 12-like [Takifugu rubripes]
MGSCRKMIQEVILQVLMTNKDLAGCGKSKVLGAVCQNNLKFRLKGKFRWVSEGLTKAGRSTLLNQIYTELLITEGGSGGVNNEHEVRYIEQAARKAKTQEITVGREDIFKPLPGRDKSIRTVMTTGVAGIGKTVLTQKFTLDWAENKTNQETQFIFPFTFRELNYLKGKTYSLVGLVHDFFPETKQAGLCRFDHFRVVFIFDGLHECRLPLDFRSNQTLKLKNVKYDGRGETDSHWCPQSRDLVECLGKLAFEQLQKGNVIFYESNQTECGIDVTAATVYSGMFTQIFKEEKSLYQTKEALTLMTCLLLSGQLWSLYYCHQRKIWTHLTLRNTLIQRKELRCCFQCSKPPEKLCTYPTDMHYLNSMGSVLSSESSALRELDLSDNNLEQPKMELLAAGLESPCCNLQSLRLSSCVITKDSCACLALALQTNPSHLKELDLSYNPLGDGGVMVLSAALKDPHCMLHKLRLSGCNLSEGSCRDLALVLSTETSSIKDLDLSDNNIQDSGLMLLSDGLNSPHCQVEVVRLSGCDLSPKSCEVLASALNFRALSLRELELNNNNLGDSGVELLSAALKAPQCSLQTLRSVLRCARCNPQTRIS